jgi:hypothetical protein
MMDMGIEVRRKPGEGEIGRRGDWETRRLNRRARRERRTAGQGTKFLLRWADAVVGDEGLGVGEVVRDAGGGDGFAAVNAGGDFEVEVEELLEEVFLGGEVSRDTA